MPLQIIHKTAAWSNAVLVAVLPHFSDFSKNLNLPIPLPITTNQVAQFVPPRVMDQFAARAQPNVGTCTSSKMQVYVAVDLPPYQFNSAAN